MSLPIVDVRTIDFKKFLNSGTLVDTLESVESSKKCYIITNLPDSENINVKAIVERASKKTFDESYKVILRLADSTTKIRTIKDSGQGTYLNVWGDFSLPDHLEIQGQSQIYLVGSSNYNSLCGNKANKSQDAIWGGAGRDFLRGKGGDDRLRGGANRDMIDGGIDNDVLHGDADDDWLWGKDGNDVLHGGTGDDHLNGGFGDDTLEGGSGNDEMVGGPGNNSYYFSYLHQPTGYDQFTGHDVIHLDSSSEGSDQIVFEDRQHFIARWDSEKQEAQFYVCDRSSLVYSGKSHFTVKGFAEPKKLSVEIGKIFTVEKVVEIRKLQMLNGVVDGNVALLEPYNIAYEIKGQEHEISILLPKSPKEVFLPAKCKFVSLQRLSDKNFVQDAIPKIFTDDSKKGELNKLFGVQ